MSKKLSEELKKAAYSKQTEDGEKIYIFTESQLNEFGEAVLINKEIYMVFETGPESSYPRSPAFLNKEDARKKLDELAKEENELDRETYNEPPILGYYHKVNEDRYVKTLYALHIKIMEFG